MESPHRCAALTFFILSISLLLQHSLYAQETDLSSPRDTASYALPEIVVTGTRSDALLSAVPSPVTLVLGSEISMRPGSFIASSLAGTPGLFLRPYGGNASLQTLSLRGMSPEHTLVLLDGERMNDFQIGQVDFGLLPSSNIERVEIVRGGYSGLYGADAVGGVVNLTTKKPPERLSADVLNSVGSNGYFATEVDAGGTIPGLGWRGTIRREGGRGDYRFNFTDGVLTTALRRSGADFREISADTRLDVRMNDDFKTWLTLSYVDANRGVPGAVTDTRQIASARQADRDVRSHLAVEWRATTELTARLSAAVLYEDEEFNDPHLLVGGSPVRTFSLNRSLSVTPEVRFNPGTGFSGTAGFEIVRGWVNGDELRDTIRWQRSAYVTATGTFTFERPFLYELIVYPALRLDGFSDVRGDFSPRIGVNLGILKSPDLRLRSSYGKSFHAPTFNDLYWFAGGNPALRPERSLSFDCGLVSTLHVTGSLSLEASYFSIVTRDRIVWTPTSGSFWSPKNIGVVDSRGVEAEARWTDPRDIVSLSLNSTWMKVRKKSEDYPGDPSTGKLLIYLPQQTVNAEASAGFPNLRFLLQYSWVSFRFTTEINDRFLPSYGLLNAAVRCAVPAGPVKASFKVEVTNVLDTSYQVIALYPMPLREVRGTLGVEL